MNKILIILTAALLTGFYDFSIIDINGSNINLSEFKGKKVLLVNTASNSRYTSQYGSLEQLFQKYKDSLIVIAIPSNSFGNETKSSASIKNFVNSNYNIHYLLAQKMDVAGDSISSLYAWLAVIDKNGMMSNSVTGDFYKYLISSDGQLIGAFVPSVDPMSEEIQNAVAN
jgi:glutathione peroxidase